MLITFCRDAAYDDYTPVLFREPFTIIIARIERIIYPSRILIMLFLTF